MCRIMQCFDDDPLNVHICTHMGFSAEVNSGLCSCYNDIERNMRLLVYSCSQVGLTHNAALEDFQTCLKNNNLLLKHGNDRTTTGLFVIIHLGLSRMKINQPDSHEIHFYLHVSFILLYLLIRRIVCADGCA